MHLKQASRGNRNFNEIRLVYRTFALIFLLIWAGTICPSGAVAALDGGHKITLSRGGTQLAVFNVTVVSEEKEREKGLAQSPPIPEDSGMLFILDDAGDQFFWMKGMEFPLDILFFDRDKKLLDVLPDLTPCEQCTKYMAPAHSAYALEINAGLSRVLGIKPGDRFDYGSK